MRVLEAKTSLLNHEDLMLRTYASEVLQFQNKYDSLEEEMLQAQAAAQQQNLMPSGSEARDADALIRDVDTPKAAQQVTIWKELCKLLCTCQNETLLAVSCEIARTRHLIFAKYGWHGHEA